MEIEKQFKEYGTKQIDIRLCMERLDKKLLKLGTKVNTMFTPVKKTFEYKNLLIKRKPDKTDLVVVLHCSNQQFKSVLNQVNKNSCLSTKAQEATNLIL